jgi:hypothetical protein
MRKRLYGNIYLTRNYRRKNLLGWVARFETDSESQLMAGNGIHWATEEGSGIAETTARAIYCQTFIAGDDPANERWSDKGYVHLATVINSREMGSKRISCCGRLTFFVLIKKGWRIGVGIPVEMRCRIWATSLVCLPLRVVKVKETAPLVHLPLLSNPCFGRPGYRSVEHIAFPSLKILHGYPVLTCYQPKISLLLDSKTKRHVFELICFRAFPESTRIVFPHPASPFGSFRTFRVGFNLPIPFRSLDDIII